MDEKEKQIIIKLSRRLNEAIKFLSVEEDKDYEDIFEIIRKGLPDMDGTSYPNLTKLKNACQNEDYINIGNEGKYKRMIKFLDQLITNTHTGTWNGSKYIKVGEQPDLILDHNDADAREVAKNKKRGNNEDMEDNFAKDKNILKQLTSWTVKRDSLLKEFHGQYKYFVGARKDSEYGYDYIYENVLEIFPNGEVSLKNPFNDKEYLGLAIIRNEKCLQIVSPDFMDGKIEGIGRLCSLEINLYGRRNILIPGVDLTFDADMRPVGSQVLLCTRLDIDKKHLVIREYFDTLGKNLRLYCPNTTEVAAFIEKHPDFINSVQNN